MFRCIHIYFFLHFREKERKMSNESEAYMTQITLQYMINKKQYGKFVEKKVSVVSSEREEYKDRFLSLTEDLLFPKEKKENEIRIPTDLKLAFENFLKTSIQHFKHIDSLPLEETDTLSASSSHNHVFEDNDVVNGEIEDDEEDEDTNDEPSEENLYHDSEDDDMYL